MIELDEASLQEEFKPLFRLPEFERALTNVMNDRLSLSLLLMALSYLEGIGELAIGAIRQGEVAQLMHDLRRHELEEHGHMIGIRLVVEELFSEFFEAGRYRYENFVYEKVGKVYSLTVRETARRRLRQLGRYSPLNLYLTITFGGEIVVQVLYAVLIDALERSTFPAALKDRVRFVLQLILDQEETHDVLLAEQHNALLGSDRSSLSAEAREMLDQLGRLTGDDYRWTTEFMMRAFVSWTSAFFADLAQVRTTLESESRIVA